MFRKLLCKLGFHAWLYNADKTRRGCLFCEKYQYKSVQDPGSLLGDVWEDDYRNIIPGSFWVEDFKS